MRAIDDAEPAAGPFKLEGHVFRDLESLDRDMRADGSDEVRGSARRLSKLTDGGGHDAPDYPAPSGVGGRHSSASPLAEQHWHAVRGANRAADIGGDGREAIGFTAENFSQGGGAA